MFVYAILFVLPALAMTDDPVKDGKEANFPIFFDSNKDGKVTWAEFRSAVDKLASGFAGSKREETANRNKDKRMLGWGKRENEEVKRSNNRGKISKGLKHLDPAIGASGVPFRYAPAPGYAPWPNYVPMLPQQIAQGVVQGFASSLLGKR